MRSRDDSAVGRARQRFGRLRGRVERLLGGQEASDSPGAERPGVDDLARRLYLAAHCRARGSAGGADASERREALRARVRSALGDLHGRYDGWAGCRQEAGAWVLATAEGVRVRAPATPLATGAGWEVEAPPLGLPTDLGWVYWVPAGTAPRLDARLYLNLAMARAPETWAGVVAALHHAGVAGRAKLGATRAVLRRADSAVVYVGTADVARTVALLREQLAGPAVGGWAAGFAYPAGPGIGVGLGPDGTSFGYSWALRLVRGSLRGRLGAELGALWDVWLAAVELVGERR